MTKEGRASRGRSETVPEDVDRLLHPVKAAPGAASEAISATPGRRKDLRDRARVSADRLGLEPAPERPSTKALLMSVGEVVIGRRGVEGVTLREIGQLAGQSNSNVVQYHFENKEGLIYAILEDRVRRSEALRIEQLEALKAVGLDADPRKLLEILWLPTLSFQDKHGNHAFCRFMLQCRLHPEFSKRFPHDERYESSVLVELMKLFRQSFHTIPKEIFTKRFSTLTLMFVASVVEFDNLRQIKDHGLRFDPEQVIDMAIAALSAPYGKS